MGWTEGLMVECYGGLGLVHAPVFIEWKLVGLVTKADRLKGESIGARVLP